MHYDIINRQGYVIGNAIVMGDYSYYMLNKESFTRTIDTDELYKKFHLREV